MDFFLWMDWFFSYGVMTITATGLLFLLLMPLWDGNRQSVDYKMCSYMTLLAPILYFAITFSLWIEFLNEKRMNFEPIWYGIITMAAVTVVSQLIMWYTAWSNIQARKAAFA